jgi:hypothetical protein
MKRYILLAAVLLAGCSKGMSNDTGEGFPPGTKRLLAPGNRVTWIVPVTMDDGTRCIATVSNGTGGGHVACNWR